MDDQSSAPPPAAAAQDLTIRIRHPGFTPKATQAKELISLLLEVAAAAEDGAKGREREQTLKDLTRVLGRIPAAAAVAVVAAMPDSVRPVRGELVALAGRLAAANPEARELLAPPLYQMVRDDDLKAQLNAVQALGRLGGDDAVDTLVELLSASPRRELRLALVRALGRMGGARGRAALTALVLDEDPQASQLRERAVLIATRDTGRDESSEVNGVRLPKIAVPIRLSCRRGLEHWLKEEAVAAGFAVQDVDQGSVTISGDVALGAVRALRLAEGLELVLKDQDGPLPVAVEAALLAATPLLKELTDGPVRYRLDVPGASDGQIWSLASRLGTACPGLVNDPTGSTWEVHVEVHKGRCGVTLEPKKLADPRFTYRHNLVYAASHPTIAAALARVAEVKPNDSVWDPFVGSGTELIERARLGSYKSLTGTDHEALAVAAATENVAAAGLKGVTLTVADALTYDPKSPTLIISNPPMGRRVQRGTLEPLIDGFVAHAAESLAPGGRLVWLSPLPERTASALKALGLTLDVRQLVDMGGFDAELQRAWKPLPPPSSKKRRAP